MVSSHRVIVAVMLQTPPVLPTVPSVVSLPTFLWSLLGVGVSSSVIASFLLLAGIDRLILRRLKHEENAPLFDALIIAAFVRKKGEIMALLNEWYAVDRQRNEETARNLEVNTDRLEAFEEAVKRQGEELSRQSRDQFERSTRAQETMTDTLAEIQKEAKAMAIAVVRIETRMNEWDGRERRRRDDDRD